MFGLDSILALGLTTTTMMASVDGAAPIDPLLARCNHLYGKQACICLVTLTGSNFSKEQVIDYCSLYTMPQPIEDLD